MKLKKVNWRKLFGKTGAITGFIVMLMVLFDIVMYGTISYSEPNKLILYSEIFLIGFCFTQYLLYDGLDVSKEKKK